jgi:small GTP-binding protein
VQRYNSFLCKQIKFKTISLSVHKSGFVNIIGCPNVGKSTLLNALVGERLSIITSKAQTTRHRIMGIVSGDDYQIVFSDTPGILKPNYKLQEKMMQFVITAFSDADVFLLITDIYEDIAFEEEYLKKLQNTNVPILLLINKIDLGNQEVLDEKIALWKERLPKAEIIPISALKKFNLHSIMNRLAELLPPGEAFYHQIPAGAEGLRGDQSADLGADEKSRPLLHGAWVPGALGEGGACQWGEGGGGGVRRAGVVDPEIDSVRI